MEDTFLFELLERKYIDSYREKLEKNNINNMTQDVIDAREALEKSLDKDRLKLFKNYISARENKEMYIDLFAETRILNYGIKIGMSLQKAFDEYDDV